MAYNYEESKRIFEGMSAEQKNQFMKQNQNDEGFRRFATDYMNEKNSQSTSTQSSTPSPQQNHQQNPSFDNGQNWGNQNQNQTSFSDNDNQQRNEDQNQTFDNSRFNNPNAQVQVQAGNAKYTWTPDYQDNSDARMQEITNNLNAYWNSNREMFRDRETFNRNFNYGGRSKHQQDLLDSFWKRKEDFSKVGNYSDWKSVYQGMQNGELTRDQMEILKEQFPEIYQQYQEKVREVENLRIVNKTVPNDITDNAELIKSLIEKLNIQVGDSRQIHQNFLEGLEKYGVLKDNQRLASYQDKITNVYSEIAEVEQKIRSQSSGASESLIQARIQKATGSLYTRASALQQGYSAILQGRQQNLAIATAETNSLIQQTAEEQRIFNNKLSSLWFAMKIASFETPEQEQARKLRGLEAQNQLALKQQEELTLMQNRLKSQLSDLSVKDPEQLKANLHNALSPYFEKYGSIIMRSQAGVVEDVLALAKREWISVAKALEKSFITPLQAKGEYKAMVNKQMGYTGGQKVVNVGGKPYIQTINSDGTISFSPFEAGGSESWVLDFLASENNIWDISTNEDLLKKYPNEASYKNNNPTGITWWVSDALKQKWEDAGVKFEKGTPRPKQEGGNYVKFATMDEGLRAYKIAFTQNGGSDIFERLKKWKGAGSEADKESYALSIMKQAGIAKGEKFSGLSNEKMNALLNAHLRRESPWLYKELSKRTAVVSESAELSVDEIMSFNDKSLNRKLSNEERKRIGDMKNKVMADPNADIEKILSYSQWGDKLTDTPTQSLVKYAQVLNQIGTLQWLLKGESTGPILWILRSNDPYDKKARQIQVAINAMVPTLARWVYGEVGVLTDKDMENYSKTVPNLKSPEEVNNAILAMTLNMLAQGYKNQLRTLAAAGKDVSGFWGVYKNIMDQVDVLKTNSSPETLESKGAKHRGKENLKIGAKNYSTSDFND